MCGVVSAVQSTLGRGLYLIAKLRVSATFPRGWRETFCYNIGYCGASARQKRFIWNPRRDSSDKDT